MQINGINKTHSLIVDSYYSLYSISAVVVRTCINVEMQIRLGNSICKVFDEYMFSCFNIVFKRSIGTKFWVNKGEEHKKWMHK